MNKTYAHKNKYPYCNCINNRNIVIKFLSMHLFIIEIAASLQIHISFRDFELFFYTLRNLPLVF